MVHSSLPTIVVTLSSAIIEECGGGIEGKTRRVSGNRARYALFSESSTGDLAECHGASSSMLVISRGGALSQLLGLGPDILTKIAQLRFIKLREVRHAVCQESALAHDPREGAGR
jgi:hypothetical protein